jgi:uncharacterized protein
MTSEIYGAVNIDNEGMRKHGDWIRTYTGRRFHLLDPRPEGFSIEDIAHALSLTCRFNGHVKKLYSVAEHSVRVAQYLKSRKYNASIQYDGLMHDCTEAYITDIARPYKQLDEFKFYRDIEDNLQQHLSIFFKFSNPLPPAVKIADQVLLATEARDLMGNPSDWHFKYNPIAKTIKPWSAKKAERKFLELYYKLCKEHDDEI